MVFLPSPSSRFTAITLAGLSVAMFSVLGLSAAKAQSQLLDSVKQNPALARQLCAQLRQMNSAGISSTSSQALATIAQQQNLSTIDAEVLTTYVVGLYCPDVR